MQVMDNREMEIEKVVRQSNDDTLTKLGDIFHYLVVVQKCLELKQGQTIIIEKYGDLSIQAETESINMELKFHGKQHYLNDRNIDFWKTLNNWLKYHENMLSFNSLVLFTTSDYSPKSVLINWNNCDAKERLEILKEIGQTKTKKEVEKMKDDSETVFRSIYNKVFSYEQSILLEILGKTTLSLNQMDMKTLQDSLLQNVFFRTFSKSNRLPFIHQLVGNIMLLPTISPNAWSISFDEFENLAINLRDRFANNKIPLLTPTQTTIKEGSEEYESYKKKRFVQEIKDIEYDIKIPRAISCYYKAQDTIASMSFNNPIFTVDLNEFQEELIDELSEYKTTYLAQCDNASEKDIIANSRLHYDSAMQHPAKDYKSVQPNRSTFQKGIVHKLVEERGYTWKVTK